MTLASHSTARRIATSWHKLYKELKDLEVAKEKACKGVFGDKLRELRVGCTEKKREYKLNVFKHCQGLKHAQISSAAVQMQEEAQSRAYQEEEEDDGEELSSIEEVEDEEGEDEERERLRSEIDSVEQKEAKGESGVKEETWTWDEGEPSVEVTSVERLEVGGGIGRARGKGEACCAGGEASVDWRGSRCGGQRGRAESWGISNLDSEYFDAANDDGARLSERL